MSQLSPNVQQALRLLLDEGQDAAQLFLDVVVKGEVDKALADLQEKQRDYAAVANVITAVLRAIPSGDTQEGPGLSDVASIWSGLKRDRYVPASLVQMNAVGLGTATLLGLDGEDDQSDRELVLTYAPLLARMTGAPVKIDEVVQFIETNGHKLRSRRPGTTVANILFRASGWDRIDAGVFKLTDQPVTQPTEQS